MLKIYNTAPNSDMIVIEIDMVFSKKSILLNYQVCTIGYSNKKDKRNYG